MLRLDRCRQAVTTTVPRSSYWIYRENHNSGRNRSRKARVDNTVNFYNSLDGSLRNLTPRGKEDSLTNTKTNTSKNGSTFDKIPFELVDRSQNNKRISKMGSYSPAILKDVLSRTTVITDAGESARALTQMIDRKEPVAVDMEGITFANLGMIQLKSSDGHIYLLRTGVNRDILTKGLVKELMENPQIVKVMFGCGSDCTSMYQEGIKLWNVYDLNLAHRVVNFQNYGATVFRCHNVNFNQICEMYGFKPNPLKVVMKDSLWRNPQMYTSHDELNADMIFYSAYDVEPLLDLYNIFEAMIAPDFQPLLQVSHSFSVFS